MGVGSGAISFPGLGISDIEISKVAFRLFGIDFNWYGIIIGIGFALALLVGIYLCKKAGESVDNLLDAVIIATPFAIIGARTYYVLFTLDYYTSFWDYFKIWQGGIAIYGALIAAVLTVFVFSKIRKISFLSLMDIAAPALLLAQSIGRWGNFVNQEAFGAQTGLPWRMDIVIDGTLQAVHPTFLYESLWNILGFVLLLTFFSHRKWKGEVFVMYIGWYGLGRAFIEGLRTDSLMIFGTIRVSQWLAAICFIAAVTLLVMMRLRMKKQALSQETYTPQFAQAVTGDDQETAEETAQETAEETAPSSEAALDELPLQADETVQGDKEQEQTNITEETNAGTDN